MKNHTADQDHQSASKVAKRLGVRRDGPKIQQKFAAHNTAEIAKAVAKFPATVQRQQYVLGFLFNEAGTRVLLMLKDRPKKLAGQWNGIGGKVEPLEWAHKAMKRECLEETSLIGIDWRCFAKVDTEDNALMWCFCAFDPKIDHAQTCESEPIQSWLVADLPFEKPALRHNVPWLVHMALTCKRHPRYGFKIQEIKP
jgi:8-oxo-dGTP pyrophosphatase MutT (NUDIX family)